MKNLSRACSIVLAISALSGCIQREPGPAERIGRSIDDFAQGVKDLDKEYSNENGSSAERNRADNDLDSADQRRRAQGGRGAWREHTEPERYMPHNSASDDRYSDTSDSHSYDDRDPAPAADTYDRSDRY